MVGPVTERRIGGCYRAKGHFEDVLKLMVESDGRRHTYTTKHLDDEWGFLTGQPLRPAESEDLQPISAEAFQAVWGA
jgi:hypothetical protein